MSGAAKKNRSSCIAALALLLVLITLIAGAIVWPWQEQNRAYDEQLQQRSTQLRQYVTIKNKQGDVESELTRLEKEIASSGYYLAAANPSLAAADLQKNVKDRVEQNNGKLISIQALPLIDDGKARKVALRVRMAGEVDALFGVMHALESQTPILLVDNLTVRSKTVRKKSPQEADTYSLDVQFDVAAYLRGAGQ